MSRTIPAGASRLTALLIAYICPICALFAPCQPGAALRDSCKTSRFQGASWRSVARDSRRRVRQRSLSAIVNLISMETVGHAIVIGAGATALMDLWLAFLRRWRVPSLDYALLGRWIGHFPRGRFMHENIGSSAGIRHERIIGWTAHYAIGVFWAALLLAIWGSQWLEHPTLGPALIVSSCTLAAPFFVMQPAMGAGVAASRTPRPHGARLRSVVTHTVYGVGLYASARLWALLSA